MKSLVKFLDEFLFEFLDKTGGSLRDLDYARGALVCLPFLAMCRKTVWGDEGCSTSSLHSTANLAEGWQKLEGYDRQALL